MAPPDFVASSDDIASTNIERIRRWTDGLAIEAYQANPMLRECSRALLGAHF